MLGGARNGYCSTDKPGIVTTPIMTVRIAMTIATIGRRMKNWPMGYFPPALAAGGAAAGMAGAFSSAFGATGCWRPASTG